MIPLNVITQNRELFATIMGMAYLLYTYKFYLELRKSAIFTPFQKKIHSIFIWLVPFIWTLILKGMMNPVKGSHHYKKKRYSNDRSGYDDNPIGESDVSGHSDHGGHHGGH
jgi:hypothetical protein